MKNIMLIETGVVYGQGKMIPYADFFEAVTLLSDGKTARKLRDRVENLVAFQNTNREISFDFENEAMIVGVKLEETVDKQRKSIKRKIGKLNGKIN